MAGRRLDPEELALWRQVAASVRPLRPLTARPLPQRQSQPQSLSQPVSAPPTPARVKGRVPPLRAPAPAAPPKSGADLLDGSWDRRIARGLVQPDRSIDLHGHSLSSAHMMLDRALDAAIQRGDRVLLLITGRPPRPEAERPYARGAIRAAVGDWLGASRHAERIAAIRNAHPRHGGNGALYIVLRRPR